MAEALRFEIIVDDKGSATIKKFGATVQETSGQIDKMGTALSIMKWDAFINLAERAVGAAKAVYDFSRTLASSLNDIERQSRTLGMSTDEFQQWTYAAKMADVEAQTLAMGFKLLSRNMSEATQGGGQANEAFEAMGIDVTNVAGGLKPLGDMMQEIMDKFAGWKDGPEKIAIALQLFGRSGEALIPLLNRGATGFAELAAEAKKLGIVLDTSLIDAGSQAEDTFKKLEAQIEATKGKMAPLALEAAKIFDSMLEAARRFFGYYDDETKIPKNEFLGKGLLNKAFGWKGPIAEGIGAVPGGLSDAQKELDDAQNYLIKMEGYYNKLSTLTNAPKLISDAQRKELGAIQNLVRNMGWEDYAAGAEASSDATRQLNQNLLQTQGILENMNAAFSGLGITSTQSLKDTADMALYNLNVIKQLYEQEKVSANDYFNAIKAAQKAMEPLTGKDTAAERLKVEEEYQEKSRAINKDQEGWQRQQNKLIDEYTAKMKVLQDQEQPIKTSADISPALADFNNMLDKYKGVVSQIKDTKIVPTVDVSSGIAEFDRLIQKAREAQAVSSGASGGGGGGSNPLDMSKWFGSSGGESIESTVKFFGEGLSPTIPLGDAFNEIEGRVSGIQGQMNSLSAAVDFSQASTGMSDLIQKARTYGDVMQSWNAMASSSYSSLWTQQFVMNEGERNRLFGYISDTMDQAFTQSLSQLQSFMQMTGQELTKDLWNRFVKTDPKQIGIQNLSSSDIGWKPWINYEDIMGTESRQGGGTIPRTGIYKMHEGERVTPKNSSLYMGGITINLGKGTPKEQAQEVIAELQKQLKYKQIDF